MKTVRARSPLSQQLLEAMQDPLFSQLLKLCVDDDGKPLPPFANLTPEQVARAEGIDLKTLNENRMRDPDSAPPRYRISPRRWGTVVFLYVIWKIRQIRKAESGELSPRKRKDSESATAIEAAT